MNLFKKYTYTWWQIGIFKLSLLTIGVIIGAYWSEVFLPRLDVLLVVAIVLSLYILGVSLSQARK